MSAKVVRVGLVEFSERHDKRANRLHYYSRPLTANEVANFLVTCYEDVTRILRGSYQLVRRVGRVGRVACNEEVSDKLRTCYDEVTTKLQGNWFRGI